MFVYVICERLILWIIFIWKIFLFFFCHSVILLCNSLIINEITCWQICKYLQYLSLICHKPAVFLLFWQIWLSQEATFELSEVSVSAMLVYIHQKKYRSSFYSWAIFFCFHLSGSNSRYLLSGVLGGSTAALFITSDIYLKKSIPCSLHEHASE